MALNLSTLTDSSTSAGILTDLSKSASNLDLVASLENRVSGGPNATQTTASKQSRAHVPVGDGHLYLPAVSGNYASVAFPTIGSSEDFVLEMEVDLADVDEMHLVSGSGTTERIIIYNSGSAFECNLNGSRVGALSSPLATGLSVIRCERASGTVTLKQDGSTKCTLTNVNGYANFTDISLNGNFSTGVDPLSGSLKKVTLSVAGTEELNIDFSDADHKASSFTCSTGQTVTINTSGNDPATIVRKSFMRMDLVDDEYEFTTGSAVNGTIVVATLEGTYSANISLNASTQYDLQARGVASTPNHGFLKNPVGYLVSSSPLSESEITKVENYFVDKGAAARSAFGSVTNFTLAWYKCNSLTSFPLIDTSSAGNFNNAWYNCSSLTSFPLIDTSSGTNFGSAWQNCNSLTSFPAINTSSGTSFFNTWNGCTSLTSFPMIDASSGTQFSAAWYNCSNLTSFPVINVVSGTSFSNAWNGCSSLTSFPLIDTSSATRFDAAWRNCASLTTFPAGFFDSWSPASVTNGALNVTWDGCTSLTAQSVENILTSLDTSGVYGTNTGTSGGTQLGVNTIFIDYDGTTLSSATSTAITSLKSKNWAISINSVIQ